LAINQDIYFSLYRPQSDVAMPAPYFIEYRLPVFDQLVHLCIFSGKIYIFVHSKSSIGFQRLSISPQHPCTSGRNHMDSLYEHFSADFYMLHKPYRNGNHSFSQIRTSFHQHLCVFLLYCNVISLVSAVETHPTTPSLQLDFSYPPSASRQSRCWNSCQSSRLFPVNARAVLSPSWLMPSLFSTLFTVMASIFISSQNDRFFPYHTSFSTFFFQDRLLRPF